MKNTFRHVFAFAAGLVLMTAPIAAHHGDAGRYDETPFIITGTIVELKLTNPHSILVFDAADASGNVVRWQAEMSGGQQLMKQFGWTKDNPKVGDKITLNGRRVKNGSPYMSMAKRANIIMADTGKEIYVGQTPPGSPVTP
jgi:Family of unknown function (DUF6152)